MQISTGQEGVDIWADRHIKDNGEVLEIEFPKYSVNVPIGSLPAGYESILSLKLHAFITTTLSEFRAQLEAESVKDFLRKSVETGQGGDQKNEPPDESTEEKDNG